MDMTGIIWKYQLVITVVIKLVNFDPWLQSCTVGFRDHGLLLVRMGQWRHF